MRFTAVINVSKYEEDCTNALKSIADNRDYFQPDIYIVSSNKAAVSKFESEKIHIVSKLKLKQITTNNPMIMEIPPYAKFGQSALDKLKTTIKHSSIEQTVFTLRSRLGMTPPSNLMWLNGYVLVALVCQWFHSLFEFWKIHQTDDILIRCVVQKMGKSTIHPKKNYFTHRLFHNSEAPYIYDDSCIAKYPSKDYTYLFRFLSQHSHFGFSLWILLYAFYYFGFLGGALIPIMSNIYTGGFPLAFYLLVGALTLGQACIVMLLTNGYAIMPIRFLLCLLFPFYFFTFPLVLIISKLYSPKKSY